MLREVPQVDDVRAEPADEGQLEEEHERARHHEAAPRAGDEQLAAGGRRHLLGGFRRHPAAHKLLRPSRRILTLGRTRANA